LTRYKYENPSDGLNWQGVLPGRDPNQPLSIEIPMNEMVYVGLAVTSHDPSRLAEATISNVAVRYKNISHINLSMRDS